MSDQYTCDDCGDEYDYRNQALKCCLIAAGECKDYERKPKRRARRAKSNRDAAKQREAWAGK